MYQFYVIAITLRTTLYFSRLNVVSTLDAIQQEILLYIDYRNLYPVLYEQTHTQYVWRC